MVRTNDSETELSPLILKPAPFFSRRSMVPDAISEKIYFFGGVGGVHGTDSILDVSDDLWIFDPSCLSWSKVEKTKLWPEPRRCPGWLALEDRLLLWGGSGIRQISEKVTTYNFLNDFWSFLPKEGRWEVLSQQSVLSSYPSARYASVFQVVQKHFVLFGGYTEDNSLGKRKLNDTWIFYNGNWEKLPFQKGTGYTIEAKYPGPRYGCMSASDGRYVYVCGGNSDLGDHLDLWRFDIETKKWELLFPDRHSMEAPQPRYCAAFTVHGNKILLFGGRSRHNPKLNFNDFWLFDLDSDKWHKIHDNSSSHQYGRGTIYPAYHAKSATAVCGKHWYLFGGEGYYGHVSDFWRLDLDRFVWQLIQPAREDDPILW